MTRQDSGASHIARRWIAVAAAVIIVLVVGTSVLVSGVLSGEEPAATVLTTAPAAPPPPVEDWYDLTTYQTVESGAGHETLASISIGVGKEPFARAIRGSAGSSATQPANFRTWSTAGRCTRLSVWIGKDAASLQTEGVGQFVIRADEAEAVTRQASIDDAPQHVEVDISDVDRLTLLDVRAGRDAANAWGTPRVFCSAPPGKAV
ncbi:NPCBM/NEW2 domain-containing protein [Lentzea sp. NPDC092896]|uniref:NPCBM/NEW2 domain-containing protein n=1 Tax=Lentzea sp. NPDC092896 TaxID=3364127 RepID=UPI0038098C6D